MAKYIIIFLAIVYVIGFGFTFWLHTQMPVTPGLAVLRSALWFVWIPTGWPHGQRLPMD